MLQATPHQVRNPMPGVVYAPAHELREYIDAGLLTQETMADALRASCKQHAHRRALVSADVEYTYAQLDEVTDRLGAAYLALGLKPLDRVIFQIANCPELIICFYACLKAGLIPICTLSAHREQEIGYLGNHAKARMHFVQGDDPKFDDVDFAQSMGDRIPSVSWIVQARGEARGQAVSMQGLIDGMPLDRAREVLAEVPHDPFQVAVFQLSGGTTGVPKIIPRFHNEYVYNMRAVAQFVGYSPDDRLFVPMPMMHNLNMGACFGPMLFTGGMVAVAADLTPAAMVHVFKVFKPTWTVMGGPIVEKLRPAIASGALPVANLRGVISANNAPSLRELLGCTVHHVFGMTEGVMMFTLAADPLLAQDTMHGRPISPKDRVKLFQVGTEIEITEPGVEGECAFLGPYTIHGYYDAAERNKETFTSHGYYRSGDLMAFHDLGGQRFYQFRGRTKDVVDRAGEKVNCEEVENLLNRHPKVFTSAVVGMPDPVYGERICAFMTLTDAAQVPSVKDVGDFLKAQGLAKFKWPERIEVVAELPLTKAGKLNKPALKVRIKEILDAEKITQ